MSRLLIAAPRKSSGKTTVAMGMIAALRHGGDEVQPFKKGPDYIDPMWLSRAAGRPCINLDFNGMSRGEIREKFDARSARTDVSIIEGNVGLFDGLDPEGSDSNAALAAMLQCPVVLVVDCEGMTRGIAPLVQGHQGFDENIEIAGVVLNNVAGDRHEQELRAAVERYTDVVVLGAVQRNRELGIVERHLGLVTDVESPHPDVVLQAIRASISSQLDTGLIRSIADRAGPLPFAPSSLLQPGITADVRIGIARDSAFCFYYADDLEAFAQAGAELVEFSTLEDSQLPDVDGIFIGGGFPETHADRLQANAPMRRALQEFVEAGGPVYAECGGMMYFAQSLIWGDRKWEMVGSLPAEVRMQDRPVGKGYVRLAQTADMPWPQTGPGETEVLAHEFNYSSLEKFPDDTRFAYRVKRGHGIDGKRDGILYRNLFASYAHLRNTGANPWVSRFVEYVRQCRRAD